MKKEFISGRLVDAGSGQTVMNLKPSNIETLYENKPTLNVGSKKEFIGGYLQNVVPPSVVMEVTDEVVISGDSSLSLLTIGIENAKVGPKPPITDEDEIKKAFPAIFRGSLSLDEIKMLPFELRICWMYQEWNKGFVPRSIEEWAKGIGFLAFKEYGYCEDDYDMEKAVRNAINTVKSTIAFIKNYIIHPIITDAETEYITELKKHFDDGKPANEQARRDWF